MEQIEKMEHKPIAKLLIEYSIPAVLGLVVNSAYTMIDRAFVGNLPNHEGSLALAGVGVSMPITTFVIAVSACIGMGGLANSSSELGKKNKQRAKEFLGNSLSLGILAGLLITTFFFLFKDQLLQLVGASGEMALYADRFLSILMLGTVFSVLGFVIPILIRANGSPVAAVVIMVSGAFLNVFLDWLFIFQFKMGIEGPALATVIAQVMVVLLGALYLFRPASSLKPVKSDYRIRKENAAAIFSIGMVPMFNQFSVSLAQIIANWSLQHNGGTLYISAMASISSVVMIATMVLSGISQGSMPIVSFNFGRGNMKRVRETIFISLAACFAFLFLCAGLIQLFSGNIVGIFSNDPQLTTIAGEGLRLYGLLLPLMAFTTMLPGFLSLVGYPKIATGINIVKQLVIYAVFIVALPILFGEKGLWLSQPATEICTLLISLYFAKRYLLAAIQDIPQETAYELLK